MTTLKDLLRPYRLADGDKLVRLGREMDGGYVLPESALSSCRMLYSFGIGDDYSFEKHFHDYAHGNGVEMYDHTVKMASIPSFAFFKSKCTTVKIQGMSFRQPCIIKMDIEGDEYESLLAVCLAQTWIKCIVVECHWVSQNEEKLRRVLEHMTKWDMKIVHIHGNNHAALNADGLPDTIEVTFTTLPVGDPFHGVLPLVGIDFPNNPDATDYTLDFTV